MAGEEHTNEHFWLELARRFPRQKKPQPVTIDEAQTLLREAKLNYWWIRETRLGYQLMFNRRLSEPSNLGRLAVTQQGIAQAVPEPQFLKQLTYTQVARPVLFKTYKEIYTAAVHDVGFPRLGTPPDYADEWTALADAITRQKQLPEGKIIPTDLERKKRLKNTPAPPDNDTPDDAGAP